MSSQKRSSKRYSKKSHRVGQEVEDDDQILTIETTVSSSDDETDTKDKPAHVEIQCGAIAEDFVRDNFAEEIGTMSKEEVRELHKIAEDTIRQQMFENKDRTSKK